MDAPTPPALHCLLAELGPVAGQRSYVVPVLWEQPLDCEGNLHLCSLVPPPLLLKGRVCWRGKALELAQLASPARQWHHGGKGR